MRDATVLSMLSTFFTLQPCPGYGSVRIRSYSMSTYITLYSSLLCAVGVWGLGFRV